MIDCCSRVDCKLISLWEACEAVRSVYVCMYPPLSAIGLSFELAGGRERGVKLLLVFGGGSMG